MKKRAEGYNLHMDRGSGTQKGGRDIKLYLTSLPDEADGWERCYSSASPGTISP